MLLTEPELRLGAIGPFVLAQWLRPPTAPQMRQMRTSLRPWVSRTGSFASVNLIDIAQLAPMDDAAREEVAVTQRLFAAEQRALANVIEGSGFVASAARSVAAGVAFLSRVSFQQRVFDRPGPACAWLAGFFPGEAVGAAALERAVESLRAPR
jgi:hypothetical protein